MLPGLLVRLHVTDVPVELLYHDATILVGLVYTSLLFMVVPLVSSLESLDDSLIEAAYDLGANGFDVLGKIVIPHAAPGITAGCIVVFMLTLGNYLTPTLLGGKNSRMVHGADLQSVHRALQLGTGRRLRLPAARPVHRHGDGRIAAHGSALRRRDAPDMIPSLPRPLWLRTATALYVAAFLVFLFLPLAVVTVFAFNDAPYPAPPWHGFTLDWFFGNAGKDRVGMFQDGPLLASLGTSCLVAVWVTVLSVLLGTANAFLLERANFPGKPALSMLMLAPLVIPGVILGISILAFASRIADLADDALGWDLDFLRPGLPLVVLGQFSYIATIATLTISARLRRFDRTLEEAALNLGASRAATFRTIMLPYLRPALIGSSAISFLMSFADFNTTLMLVGSDSPLTVMMYGRMREGATLSLNAVSLFLMVASGLLALTLIRRAPRRAGTARRARRRLTQRRLLQRRLSQRRSSVSSPGSDRSPSRGPAWISAFTRHAVARTPARSRFSTRRCARELAKWLHQE